MPALFSEASISRLAPRLAATSDRSDPTLREEFRCCVQAMRLSGRVAAGAGRNPDYEASPCPRQKNPVLVEDVSAGSRSGWSSPTGADKPARDPSLRFRIEHHVIAPTHAGPIELQPLA